MRGKVKALFLALVLGFISLAAAPSWAQQPEQVLQVPSGWQVYRGASGLTVLHPGGWKVNEGQDGAFWVTLPAPDGGYQAIALAKPVKGGRAAGRVLAGVDSLMPGAFPGLRITGQRKLSQNPEVVEAALKYRAGAQEFQGAGLCMRHGDRAMLYIMFARKGKWRAYKKTAREILRRFLYSTAGSNTPGPTAPDLPQMRPWRDPLEGAFSAMVPSGWRVDGGLRRFHAVDVRPELVMQSPDGAILVRLGDADIPPMAVANQYMAGLGFNEGSTYSPGYGLNQLVMRYLPGYLFATNLYLPQKVGRISDVRTRNLPQLARRAQAAHQIAGIPVRVDTGEVSFSAKGQAGPLRGYAFCQTTRISLPASPGMGMWHVEYLYGYLARPAKEPLARAVLNAVAQSFKMDRGWLNRQAQTTGQVSGIVTRTNDELTTIMHEAFRNRQQTQDRAMERYVRGAVLGTVLIEDPATGQRFEVPQGSNSYWRTQGGGAIIGTHTNDRPYSPNYWFERMTVLD